MISDAILQPPLVLSLRGIVVRFGTQPVLDGLDLDLARGEIVGLCGPNGSGKSTTLGVAAGWIQPLAGRVLVNGLDRQREPHACAAAIGYVPQDHAIYDELPAARNLEFFGRLFGLEGYELDRRIGLALARAKLSQRAADRPATFSGGLRQRLSIACALIHEPALLLLDEPTTGLDAASRDDFFRLLDELRDEGRAILFSTHHPEEAADICDRLLQVTGGRLHESGNSRAQSGQRALLYGHLSTPLPKSAAHRLITRLAVDGADLEIVGRRVRLAADDSETLGRALAHMLADGAVLERFRTPTGPLPPRVPAQAA